jgi:CheY-like chemotaxis protein
MTSIARELDSLFAALLDNVELGLSVAQSDSPDSPDSPVIAHLHEMLALIERGRELSSHLASEVAAPTVELHSHPIPLHPSKAGKVRLLIVDDEAQVRRVLTVALESAGFDVVTAAAGNTALDLYDSDPHGFDLVLTDLTMPGLDGHELFDALTSRDPELPVILTSGYPDPQRTACYPDGRPALFLEKPYRLGHLLAKVHEQLGKRTA